MLVIVCKSCLDSYSLSFCGFLPVIIIQHLLLSLLTGALPAVRDLVQDFVAGFFALLIILISNYYDIVTTLVIIEQVD